MPDSPNAPDIGHGRDAKRLTPPSCWPLSCQDARALPAPPNMEDCRRLWDRYAMPEHIRQHSLLVAAIAFEIAQEASRKGVIECVQTVTASALLHDIAKQYAIEHGGNHAQLGGVWTLEETRNPAIAQGVVHHVFWPWELDPQGFFLPLTVIYADKRVRHDRIVSIGDRFEDLFERYAVNDYIRERIELSLQQALELERALSKRLGMDLHARTFDCRRLV